VKRSVCSHDPIDLFTTPTGAGVLRSKTLGIVGCHLSMSKPDPSAASLPTASVLHPDYDSLVTPDERAVLVRAIHRITEQAANANALVENAMGTGLDGSDPLVVSIRMLRAQLLSVKADLERELERVVLDCRVCGRTVHYVGDSASGPVIGDTRSQRLTRRRSSTAEAR